ncbi:MAG: ABA4-like family protein [Pseudomonadota bacterium]
MFETLDWARLFELANAAVLPAWLYLLVGPRSIHWLNVVAQYIWPAGLALAYALIVIPQLGSLDFSNFGSLDGVQSMLSNDAGMTAGWLHYLAFDLFVGGWIARQADKAGWHRIAQVPVLLATFMLGPLGLLIYLGVQAGRRRLESLQ